MPGVYLWLDHFRQPEKICNVGRATGSPTLWSRQWAHYCALISGHYLLPEGAGPCGAKWAMDYRSAAVAKVVFDEVKYVELVHLCFSYAQQIRIHLCPVERDFVKAVERQLLFELQPLDTTWGTKTRPRDALDLSHESAAWLTTSTQAQIDKSVRFI